MIKITAHFTSCFKYNPLPFMMQLYDEITFRLKCCSEHNEVQGMQDPICSQQYHNHIWNLCFFDSFDSFISLKNSKICKAV